MTKPVGAAVNPLADGRSLAEIVADVNRSLWGCYGCFQHSKGNTFVTVDAAAPAC